jgi:C4-dicarboxylate-binding protein DctP
MHKELFKAVFVLFILVGQALAGEQRLVIRFSTQAPSDAEYFQSMRHFKDRVEAESNGMIRIDLVDSGKLYDSHAIAAAVSSGSVEMGMVNLTRYGETIPIADAFSLPFLFNDKLVEIASRAPNSEIRQLIDKAILEKSGARVLWWIPEGGFVLLAKGMPMASPEALIGRTVRSSGPTSAAVLRLCGGEPDEIPATEQPKAYETGRVQVGMTSITAVMARKLFRFMNTITKTSHAVLNDAVVINESYWQSISEHQRAILKSAALIADKEAADRMVNFEDQAYRQLIEREGAQVVTLSQDELLLWRICSSDVLSDFAERAGDRGHELMAAYAKLLQDRATFDSMRAK